uniref:GDSL esterase/lipase n=1 Tax=Kalanchoe fedtschenkoi TaxID=63787 RepID=A0A7N0UZM4_KALFE
MDGQLDNFANTRQDIISLIGASAAQELLSNAIFTVEMGQNDILNNYLVPVISILEQIVVSPQSFISTVFKRYRLQLTRLHSLGASKLIVVNSAPLGCIPYMRDVNPAAAGAGCYEYANQIAETFNAQLNSLILMSSD